MPEIPKLNEPSAHNENDRIGDISNYYLWDNSKFGAKFDLKFGVLWNLEDHDFNRAIYPTT